MIRRNKPNKKVVAILTSDIHLRDDVPRCRIDDYWNTQARKIEFIRDLQEEYECYVLDGGDLFNKWKSSPMLLAWTIVNLPDKMITVAGNHDLPQHNMNLYYKSSLNVIDKAERIIVPHVCRISEDMDVYCSPWVDNISKLDFSRFEFEDEKKILLLHTMTYHNEIPFPGAEKTVDNALGILDKLPQFDLILVGHNHKPFIVEDDGRKIISVGSLMRTAVDQKDYKPRVLLLYDDLSVKSVPVPIEDSDLCIRTAVDEDEEVVDTESIEYFVEKVKEGAEIGLSFEDNLEYYFKLNDVKESTRSMIWEMVRS